MSGDDAHTVDPEFPNLSPEVLEGVEALQQKLCGEVAVGMNYEALHDRAHEVGARSCWAS